MVKDLGLWGIIDGQGAPPVFGAGMTLVAIGDIIAPISGRADRALVAVGARR